MTKLMCRDCPVARKVRGVQPWGYICGVLEQSRSENARCLQRQVETRYRRMMKWVWWMKSRREDTQEEEDE